MMKFESRVLMRMGEGGYTEYRIPGIVEHGGEAVMCLEARANTDTDWGRIDVMILGEEGRRHLFVPKGSPAAEGVTPVICEGDTLNNPTLISDGGTLHLIFHVNYFHVLYTRSADGGRTWAELREITDSYRELPYDWNVSATGPGHGIKLESGRLLAPIWLAHGEVEQGEIYSVKHYPSVAGAVFPTMAARPGMRARCLPTAAMCATATRPPVYSFPTAACCSISVTGVGYTAVRWQFPWMAEAAASGCSRI